MILFGSIMIADRQGEIVHIFSQGAYIICSAMLAEQIVCECLRGSACPVAPVDGTGAAN